MKATLNNCILQFQSVTEVGRANFDFSPNAVATELQIISIKPWCICAPRYKSILAAIADRSDSSFILRPFSTHEPKPPFVGFYLFALPIGLFNHANDASRYSLLLLSICIKFVNPH